MPSAVVVPQRHLRPDLVEVIMRLSTASCRRSNWHTARLSPRQAGVRMANSPWIARAREVVERGRKREERLADSQMRRGEGERRTEQEGLQGTHTNRRAAVQMRKRRKTERSGAGGHGAPSPEAGTHPGTTITTTRMSTLPSAVPPGPSTIARRAAGTYH